MIQSHSPKSSVLISSLLLICGLIAHSAIIQNNSNKSGYDLQKTAFVAGKSGGIISKKEVLKADRIYVYKYGDADHQVIRYRITYFRLNRDPVELESLSDKFTPLMMNINQSLNSGDRLVFDSIKFVNSRNDTLSSEDLILKIQ